MDKSKANIHWLLNKKLLALLLIVIFILSNIVKIDGYYYLRFFTYDIHIENENDVTELSTMPFINKMSISCKKLPNYNFLNNKPFLSELSMYINDNDNWSFLKKCDKLRSFRLCGINLAFDDLYCFNDMKHLEILSFGDTSFVLKDYSKISIYSLDGLDELTTLKELTLHGVECREIDISNSLSSLEFFTVKYSDLTLLHIDSINLKSLNIENNYSLTQIDLFNCNNLEKIVLYNSPNISLNISEISTLPSLKKIYISDSIFSESEMDILKSNNIEVIFIE